MEVRLFGTYDERKHPRVRVLREGLEDSFHVRADNVPVPIDTAMRVDALKSPAHLLRFVPTLLLAWLRLVGRSLQGPRPDVVVVGHLGHLDVILARLLYPRATLVLDYLISLADTARDREVGGEGPVFAVLRFLDQLATRIADIVIIDTPESVITVPAASRHKAVVVPVGADRSWFTAGEVTPKQGRKFSVVFFGLYTPLQGAPVIGAALRELRDRGVAVTVTMIGDGQERPRTEHTCTGLPVTWIDWIEAEELPTVVAAHDVCLGIFGTGAKAQRVVPNKVYQGAAAGCVIVTADSGPQRRALPSAWFVPPGDGQSLADTLQHLATAPDLQDLAQRSRFHAEQCFRPDIAVTPLVDALTHDRKPRQPSPQGHNRE